MLGGVTNIVVYGLTSEAYHFLPSLDPRYTWYLYDDVSSLKFDFG